MQTNRLRNLLMALIALPALALAGGPESAPTAKVGGPAPDFSLPDTTGKRHKLSDYKDKVVVLEWVSADCPASLFVRPAMNKLHEKYSKKGVVWLAIDSTHYQTLEKIKQYKQERHVAYDILIDKDGVVGHLYGAKTTPHMFIINKGKLVYAGAFDDGGFRRAGKTNYVAQTLDAILAGKDVPVATTAPYGCSVKYPTRSKKP